MQSFVECASSPDVYIEVVALARRRIVLTAAVLPLLVLIGLRSAWAAYACRMDGQIREACCCPDQDTDERAPADGAPRMAPASCCDVTIGESADTPQARETARDANDVPPVLVTTVADTSLVAPVARRVPSNAFARPPPRPVPTYLANRTILR